MTNTESKIEYTNDGSFKGPVIETVGLTKILNREFPELDVGYEDAEVGARLARLAIGAASLVGKGVQVKRIPNGPDGERENIAEHSFMLSVIAGRTAKELGLDLDGETLENNARFHDLLEIKVGDTNTFNLTPQELENKEKAEHAALEELLDELPGWIADYLKKYEAQDSDEARTVRAIDKLLPLAVNIAHEDLTVTRRDFDLTSLEELEHAHRVISESLAGRFNEKWLKPIIVAHAIECLIYEDIYRRKTSSGAIEVTKDPHETKRRFLISPKNLPHDLESNPNITREEIRQFYPKGEKDGSSTRVRSINNLVFMLTKKSTGTIQREEVDTVLDGMTPAAFDAWFEGVEGDMVEKTKYFIPHGDVHTIELGVYRGAHEGLIMAAIKTYGRDALSKASQVEIPSWFGQEVTNDPRYFNHRISIEGVPSSSESD